MKVVAARQALNVSQPVFARLLNVPTMTAVSWKKGRRKPSGAALRLLQIAREHPEALMEA
jgi:putative transcriptional regulator